MCASGVSAAMHAEALGGAGRIEAEAAFDEAARSVATVEALSPG